MAKVVFAQSQEIINAIQNPANTFNKAASTLTVWMIALGVAIAVGVIIWGGFKMMYAGGDTEKVQLGKRAILLAMIGLVAVIMATVFRFLIVQFLTS